MGGLSETSDILARASAVLEALSKPPYEPLWEASLKHLTF